ncbi:MAG: transcriptional repressor [Campylobacterota bacterium]|nr:transcriptional repressor [Campylobacterota bacterium]
MTNFKTILQDKDLKATHQRLVILEELEKAKHIDIDNLYDLVISSCPTLSKATLYRNLNDLVLKNIVTEVKVPDQKNMYETTKLPHIHLVCKKCRSVEDENIDTSFLLSEVSRHSHFKIEASSISLSGICEKCLAL